MIDLLFNLLITFVALFFLSFILIAEPTEDEEKVDSDALFIVTMTWDEDNDIDLWMLMPTQDKVFYGRREVGPAYLDLDVVRTGSYTGTDGVRFMVRPNQEIITIRGFALAGKHTINAHFFGGIQVPTTVSIVVTDVRLRKIVWAGERTFGAVGTERHFVQLNVVKKVVDGGKKTIYQAEVVDRASPVYFIKPIPPSGGN